MFSILDFRGLYFCAAYLPANKLLINRILDILFLGLTLSRDISGDPAHLIHPVIKSVPKTKCLIFCIYFIKRFIKYIKGYAK
jgi:hypothetical protein